MITHEANPITTTSPPRWRFVAAPVSYLAATVLASVITNPTHPAALAPVPLLLAAVAGLIGAVTMGALSERLRLPTGQRLAVVTLLVFS